MSTILMDGTGDKYKAKVDSNHRLYTYATTQTENKFVSLNYGNAYAFSTNGFISLTTTDTEIPIFYLKNTSTTKNLYISRIRTCGNVAQKIILYANPTGGTLLTNTAGTKTNINLTSSNTAEATVTKGGEGITATGGTHIAQHINGIGHSNDPWEDSLILGTNDSIYISFEVASAGSVCVAVLGYFE